MGCGLLKARHWKVRILEARCPIFCLQSNPFVHLLHYLNNEFIHGILISFFVSIIRSGWRDEFDRFLDLIAQLSDRKFQFLTYFRHFSSQLQVLSFSECLNAMHAACFSSGKQEKRGVILSGSNFSWSLHYSFQERIIETKNEISIPRMNSLVRQCPLMN